MNYITTFKVAPYDLQSTPNHVGIGLSILDGRFDYYTYPLAFFMLFTLEGEFII